MRVIVHARHPTSVPGGSLYLPQPFHVREQCLKEQQESKHHSRTNNHYPNFANKLGIPQTLWDDLSKRQEVVELQAAGVQLLQLQYK